MSPSTRGAGHRLASAVALLLGPTLASSMLTLRDSHRVGVVVPAGGGNMLGIGNGSVLGITSTVGIVHAFGALLLAAGARVLAGGGGGGGGATGSG